jgi:integrase
MGEIMERRNKKGKLRFTARIRIKGCKTMTKTFGRKTDANEWLTKTSATLLENRDFPERGERGLTLNDLITKYIAEGFFEKEASEASQTRQLKWWGERIGHVQLCHLTPKVISRTRAELRLRKNRYGKRIGNGTINRYKSALSAAITYAVEELFWLRSNPANALKQLKENKGRTRFLSSAELLALTRAIAHRRNKKLLPLFLLTIATGLRRSEALDIRWSRIDFAMKTVHIPKTKNGEARTLPLDGLVWSHILRLYEFRQPGSDLVFHGRKLDQPMDYTTAWVNALKAAGLGDFRWHDTRHTAASYLRMSGATLADIADVLGQKTLIMAKRYSHLPDENKRTKVVEMNQQFLPGDLVEKAMKSEGSVSQEGCGDASSAVGS